MPEASVKVMRSHDYCHFEIALSSKENMTLGQINEMRKDAARLVDNAVAQYKVAKRKAETNWQWERDKVLREAETIRQKPVSEWMPEDKAVMKLLDDRAWEAERNYDYNDDQDRYDFK